MISLITINAEWATPANTALLIVLGFVQLRQSRKASATSQDVVDAKRAAGATRRNGGHGDTGERRRWTD